jgi:hypothetical protein
LQSTNIQHNLWDELWEAGMKAKGRHPEKALSAVRVRSITKPGRYTDGNGLYLVVDPSGAKRWILRTIVQGKRCDIGLGGLRLVSLTEAREKAFTYRKLAREGGDPLAERRMERAVVPTFEQAAKSVHAEHSATWRNAKHRAQWLSTLTQYAFPLIGDWRVDRIDTPDILRVLSPIWLGRRPQDTGLARTLCLALPRAFRDSQSASRISLLCHMPKFPNSSRR